MRYSVAIDQGDQQGADLERVELARQRYEEIQVNVHLAPACSAF